MARKPYLWANISEERRRRIRQKVLDEARVALADEAARNEKAWKQRLLDQAEQLPTTKEARASLQRFGQKFIADMRVHSEVAKRRKAAVEVEHATAEKRFRRTLFATYLFNGPFYLCANTRAHGLLALLTMSLLLLIVTTVRRYHRKDVLQKQLDRWDDIVSTYTHLGAFAEDILYRPALVSQAERLVHYERTLRDRREEAYDRYRFVPSVDERLLVEEPKGVRVEEALQEFDTRLNEVLKDEEEQAEEEQQAEEENYTIR